MNESSVFNIISLVVGVFGSLLGGAVAWGVAKAQMSNFEKELARHDARVSALESKREDDRNAITRIEATMLARFDEQARTLEAIRTYLIKNGALEP